MSDEHHPGQINWEHFHAFLQEIGRDSGPLVLALFPPEPGLPCIHKPCTADAIPQRWIEQRQQQKPELALGLVMNHPLPKPADWGTKPEQRTPRGKPKAWGASNAHISHAIGIWAECDGGLALEAQQALPAMAGLPEPSVRNWSGSKSLHLYWLLQDGERLDPDTFRLLQQRLAARLYAVAPDAKPDTSISNPARLMRVPGGIHPATGQPCILHSTTGARFTVAQLLEMLPPLQPAVETPAAAGQWTGCRAPSDPIPLTALLPRDLEQLAEQGVSEGTRNVDAFKLATSALAIAGAAAAAGLAVDGTPENVVLNFAARCSPPLSEREALNCLRSAEGEPRSPDPGWPERLRYQLNRRQRRHDRQQQEHQTGEGLSEEPITQNSSPQSEQQAELYRILGWCPDRNRIYYYQHRETGQISAITPNAQAGPLLRLAPLAYWETLYAGRVGPNWSAASSAVIEQANQVGVFAIERVRGRGLWIDAGRTVWHLGDRLEVDGQEVALIEHRSAHHYPRLPALDIDPAAAPLSDAEGLEILQAVEAMGWATPLDALHLLGWAVLANVGGALDKRPVLQITSRFATGKTFTRERVLQPLLAGLAISRSNSTEAGIRQLLKADTLPVLIDESEGEDPHRREGHLRLARLSYDGSPTDRGTTHGQAISFAIRSSVAMVGINASINNPAERSRTVMLGRKQLPQADWASVDRRLAELLTVETGARLLRRIVNHLPTLRTNVSTFRRTVEGQLGGGAAARAGDTYGALLAGAHLLISTAQVDDTQAVGWLDSAGWSAEAALGEAGMESQDGTAEGLQCLQHLLSHEEPWKADGTGTGKLSVRELLQLARQHSSAADAEAARKALGRRGLKADDVGLRIANSPEALAPIYGRTKWRDGGHRARLQDLPGAYPSNGTVRITPIGSVRATTIPWETIKSEA